MPIDGLMISWIEGFGLIVGFIWLFIWFMTMFYVTFFRINISELDILGWQDPGLRMKPTMVEGPNSPLYISLPRSSIMPQVHGVPVACVLVGFGAVKYDVPMCWLMTIASIVEMIELKLRLNLVLEERNLSTAIDSYTKVAPLLSTSSCSSAHE